MLPLFLYGQLIIESNLNVYPVNCNNGECFVPFPFSFDSPEQNRESKIGCDYV